MEYAKWPVTQLKKDASAALGLVDVNCLLNCHIQHAHHINFKGDDVLMLRSCYTAPSWPKQSSTAALNYCEKLS